MDNSLPHRSHFVRISSAMLSVIRPSLWFQKLSAQPRCTKRIQLSCRRRAPKFSKPRQTLSSGRKFCRTIATSNISSAATDRNVVIMAATRSGIPISWTSEQIIDREKFEVRFHHLKAFTKGMRVVWTFQGNPGRRARRNRARPAIFVCLRSRHWPSRSSAIFSFITSPIEPFACMKTYLEAEG